MIALNGMTNGYDNLTRRIESAESSRNQFLRSADRLILLAVWRFPFLLRISLLDTLLGHIVRRRADDTPRLSFDL